MQPGANHGHGTQRRVLGLFTGLTVFAVLFVGLNSSVAAQATADAVATPASSQDTPPAVYEVETDRGLREFDAGSYAEARVHFLEAHRIWPNARSLRALGHCEYELGNYVSAIELLQQALVSQVRPLSADSRKETEDLQQRAREYVARYQIDTVPADARLTVDGVELPTAPKRVVSLTVGRHVLDAEASGYQPRRRELQVENNSARVLLIELTKLPESASDVGHDDRRRKRALIWSSVAVAVVAGVATALAVGLHEGPHHADGGNTNMVIQLKPSAVSQ